MKRIANGHLDEIDQKISELRSMRRTLASLIDACQGDHRPDCPILEELAGERE